jgi:hypothetical protein
MKEDRLLVVNGILVSRPSQFDKINVGRTSYINCFFAV